MIKLNWCFDVKNSVPNHQISPQQTNSGDEFNQNPTIYQVMFDFAGFFMKSSKDIDPDINVFSYFLAIFNFDRTKVMPVTE